MEIASALARNLFSARDERGLTLSGLAEISGVGKATISSIERGDGNPTIETTWRLANALGVSFGHLVEGPHAVSTVCEDGVTVSLVDRQTVPRIIESFVMDVPASAKRVATAHAAGVEEQITVLSGILHVGPPDSAMRLAAGESARIRTDCAHIYRAEGGDAKAIVTIVYPLERDDTPTVFDIPITWPADEIGWASVQEALRRACIEVQNGIDLRRLVFTGCTLERQAAAGVIRERLVRWPLPHPLVQTHALCDPAPGIAVMGRPDRFAPLEPGESDPEAWAGHFRLARLAGSLAPPDLATKDDLVRAASKADMLTAALAAEALTSHGIPTAPAGIGSKRRGRALDCREDVVLFEHRIDVDDYEAYELVHPAYARQVLAAAQAIKDNVAVGSALLDIGTGPGLPLEMFLTLLPGLRVTAVDPSEAAFEHLARRFAEDRRVTPVNCGIDSFAGSGALYDAALSIGASHHLDTALFFRSVAAQLKPGGVLVVADEMAAPFQTEQQRHLNLVAHHLQYIADTMVPIVVDRLSPTEAEVVERLRSEVPGCLALARAGKPEAVSRLRRLHFIIRLIPLPEPVTDPLMAFYRFHLLELQALIAGLDYEVEQKTHARRLVALAGKEGFRCEAHRRLYATHGDGEWDAGTHLFTFRKQR